MSYTVKQLADIAGVSPRTLRYYDAIGLLAPSALGENGYRLYGEASLLRLQQILFLREIDFSLEEIRQILDRPDFDVQAALLLQREALQQQTQRIQRLIVTIDQTTCHLTGEITMQSDELFAGFDPARQVEWEQEMREKYGDTLIAESQRNFARYSQAEREQIRQEGDAVYRDLIALVGSDPASPYVQAVMRRWHDQIRHFYDPSPEVMIGLSQMYTDHPDFAALFSRMHPDLPAFLREAVTVYANTSERR